MNQSMRVFAFLSLLFCLPVLLLAQRPVSVRTDEGRGVKQEQQTTAAERPAATTAPAETTRPARTTARTGADSEAEETCPTGHDNDQTRARRQPTDRPIPPRTRTTPRRDRPAPRTTSDRQEYGECDCNQGHANAHKGKSGNRGRGWAHGHNKKANPNDRARRIPSVPAHGKKARTKGGFSGGMN